MLMQLVLTQDRIHKPSILDGREYNAIQLKISSLVALYSTGKMSFFGNSWIQNRVLHAHVLPATPIQPVAVLTQMGDSVGISTNVQSLQRFAIKMVTRVEIQLREECLQNVIIMRVLMTVIAQLDIGSQQTRVINTFRKSSQ